jgi:hypothetical protein
MNLNELLAVVVAWVFGMLVAATLFHWIGLGPRITAALATVVGFAVGILVLRGVVRLIAWLTGPHS